MVWNAIVDYFVGEPQLAPDEQTRLPPYFPVEPKGCEHHAQKLFACVANEATDRAREMEKAGVNKLYFGDVERKPVVQKAVVVTVGDDDTGKAKNPNVPKEGDNPLDECRTLVAYYKRCCDRELKKKQNWILTEPYRVQEEYRYQPEGNGGGAQIKK